MRIPGWPLAAMAGPPVSAVSHGGWGDGSWGSGSGHGGHGDGGYGGGGHGGGGGR